MKHLSVFVHLMTIGWSVQLELYCNFINQYIYIYIWIVKIELNDINFIGVYHLRSETLIINRRKKYSLVKN